MSSKIQNLKNFNQLNGKISEPDITFLQCNNVKCGQIHFEGNIHSKCPDCKIGHLQSITNPNNNTSN